MSEVEALEPEAQEAAEAAAVEAAPTQSQPPVEAVAEKVVAEAPKAGELSPPDSEMVYTGEQVQALEQKIAALEAELAAEKVRWEGGLTGEEWQQRREEQRQSIVERVVAEKRLGPEAAKFLSGDTYDELTESAKALIDAVGRKPGGGSLFSGTGRERHGSGGGVAELALAHWAKQAGIA